MTTAKGIGTFSFNNIVLFFVTAFFLIDTSASLDPVSGLDSYRWPNQFEEKCSALINLTKNSDKCHISNCHNNNNIFSINNRDTDISHHFIVVFKEDIEIETVQSQKQLLIDKLTNFQEETINGEGESLNFATINHVYDNCLNGFSASLSPNALDIVIKNEFVEIIEQDQYAYTLGLQRNPIWNLDRIDQTSDRLNNIYDTGKLNGEGIDIYILDTGINQHTEFTGRLGNGKNFVADNRGWGDCNGHGTHCAGTAAGTKWGVAKDATLHSVRILDCSGRGAWSNILGGIDWVVEERERKGHSVIASMSLGGSKSTSLNKAVERAQTKGVIVVVAAGNENKDACNTSPSSANNVISVGSTTINDRRSGFSNFGKCVTIFAPGSNIKSANYLSRTGSKILSGTSMACPHVAGTMALLLEEYGFSTPNNVLIDKLYTSATRDKIIDPRGKNILLRTPDKNEVILLPTPSPIFSPTPIKNGCRTVSGPQPDRECQFPFRFRDRIFSSCTSDFDQNGRRWCSVELDSQGKHISGKWGYCPNNCGDQNNKPTPRPTLRSTNRPTNFPSRSPTIIEEDECLTVRGPRLGEKCQFPFIFGGKTYNECTNDIDVDGQFWCSVRVDSERRHISGQWGYCDPSCLDNPVTSTPTSFPTPFPTTRNPTPRTNPTPFPPTRSPTPLTNPDIPSNNNKKSCEILEGINKVRKDKGLSKLTLDNRLQQAAQKHARDMAVRGYFSHESPDGLNADDRVIRKGYVWWVLAENIAAGYRTTQQAVEGWLKSPGHLENILCEKCQNTGIGVYYDQNSTWKYYYVQVFASTEQNIINVPFSCQLPTLVPTRPNINSCQTIDGPNKNIPCQFPFKYYDNIYDTCIVEGNSQNRPWCSTKVDSEGNHIGGEDNWGYCPPTCKVTKIDCQWWQWWCNLNLEGIVGDSYKITEIEIPKLTMKDIDDGIVHIELVDTNKNLVKNGNHSKDNNDEKKVSNHTVIIISIGVSLLLIIILKIISNLLAKRYRKSFDKPKLNTPEITRADSHEL